MRWTFMSAVVVLLPVASLAQTPALGPTTAITVSGPVVGSQMTLVWSAVPDATHYHVRVADATETRLDDYYPVEEAGCAKSGVCTLTIATDGLTPGAGRWWVQAWSAVAEGPWTDGQAFTYVEVRVNGTLVTQPSAVTTSTSAATGSAPTTGARTNVPSAATIVPEITGPQSTAFGIAALSAETSGNENSAFGYVALRWNTTGSGNTASGAFALRNNTTGNYNTASGEYALHRNETGVFNTATGQSALLENQTGSENTAVGVNALRANTGGSFNTASGVGALGGNTTGGSNTAAGYQALSLNTTGPNNTAVGRQALYKVAGMNNTALGYLAGYNLQTGTNNLYLDSVGQSTESQVIRIGDTQTRTFIKGIRGRTTGQANAVTVLIDSNGQLGTVSSSRRYKEDIRDMAEASSGLLRLRPVTFRYKEPYADGSQPIEYGLIAEEVAEVYPDLVVYDEDGQVETVQYHKVNALLLNEVQKQARENQQQADQIREQAAQIRALLERMAALEGTR